MKHALVVVPMSTAGNIVLVVALVVMGLCGLFVLSLNAMSYDTFSRDKTKRQQGRQRQARDRQLEAKQKTDQRASQRQAQADTQAQIVCQFCHQAGQVTTRMMQQKQGVSGGKATSALLTGGVSLFAVGLSKKGWVTRLTCGNCKMHWDVAG